MLKVEPPTSVAVWPPEVAKTYLRPKHIVDILKTKEIRAMVTTERICEHLQHDMLTSQA